MAWDFHGAERVRDELANGPTRLRVGMQPEGRPPARGHTPIQAADGTPVGEITSGGFGPSLNGPMAMGYVAAPLCRGRHGAGVAGAGQGAARPRRPAPFVPHRYKR